MWWIRIIIFIASIFAIFFTGLWIMNLISTITNPTVELKDGNLVDKYSNAKLVMLIIMAFSWAMVISLMPYA